MSDFQLISNKFPEEQLNPNGKIFGEVRAVDGRASLINGKPIPCDEIDFVVTSDSRLLIGRKHTTLANNSDVLAVGSIYFKKGKIRKITNLSGHYRPTVEEGRRFPQILQRLGFDTSGVLFELYESGLKVVNTRLS